MLARQVTRANTQEHLMPPGGSFSRIVNLSASGIRKLSAYVCSFALFLWGLTKLQAPVKMVTGHSEPWLIMPIAALPLVLVAAFELIPKAWSSYKSSRLADYGFSITQEVSGNFRVAPYEDTEQDRKQFRRADNIHVRILEWIKTTTQTIVYVTGRSGTGKTSVINAYVMPELRTSTRFLPLVIRSFAAPLREVRRRLLLPGLVWKQPIDNPSETLLELLGKAAAKTNKRIVLIFEQFEELLIAPQPDRPTQAVRELLIELQSTGSQDALVVISIRNDYIALLQEMGPPMLRAEKT